MKLDPLQDIESRLIRAGFGAVIGVAVAAFVWAVEPADELPAFVILASGLALIFAFGTAFFGHVFWREVAARIDE